ncbi:hypothetical protein CP533_2629 [Ophiocordyceps camponoti-saundersi (nom. inval.)]|nr:hypothetical protein CP533_2629 [Ophiocordyceps camponoti-saundersi (nom. inval.)]
MASQWTKTVFRLSKIPIAITAYSELAALVASASDSVPASSITVYSLATTLVPWESPPTRVATLMFKETPAFLAGATTDEAEWQISVSLSDDDHVLILDHHFWGMTPLNNVQDENLSADCIAISGLAGHAFGSWAPRGEDKTFMWIRDQVPKELPGVRAILYGYEAGLLNSKSFQGIEDLAMCLIAQMKANGLDESSKPLIFLAHSLGGIVLKSAVRKLASAEDNLSEQRMFSRITGAVMFGVPNLGMEQNHLLTLIQDKHVRNIVDDLSKLSGRSGYLHSLELSVSGIAEMRHIRFLWAYETDVSPTFDGQTRKMTGLPVVLVDPGSATAYRVTDAKKQKTVIPVTGNHSTIVKFTRSDYRLRPIVYEMRDYCGLQSGFRSNQSSFPSPVREPVASGSGDLLAEGDQSDHYRLQELIDSLSSPELNLRREGIANQFESTCEWIFDNAQFMSWLRGDEGVFWINGKPGSGKSTLMKFILKHPHIRDYGRDFSVSETRVTVDFFFNFRGTSLQKSLNGLMQNVLRRVLKDLQTSDNAKPIINHILSSLPEATPNGAWWTRERMEQVLRTVLNQDLVRLSITFFIDALDEFDGSPEQILRFLKYLEERPPESLTRTRICFSSRPWDIFAKAFGGGPDLAVQDFTQNDIRHYCTSTLASTLTNNSFIRPLADEIASRASGVFLWVTLVTEEIARKSSSSASLESLMKLVNGLPTELENFYDLIIQRIPRNERLRTYALLEALIRARYSAEFGMKYLYRSTLISYCHTYIECQEALQKAKFFDRKEALVQARKQILYWSGGLASVGDDDKVQLIHQTAYEFIVKLDFRDRLLAEVSRTVSENGHTFHFKSMLLADHKPKMIKPSEHPWDLNHGLMAEQMTGQRWWTFLNSFPRNHIETLNELFQAYDYDKTYRDYSSDNIYERFAKSAFNISRPIGLAVMLGLRLYLEDLVDQEPWPFAPEKCPDFLLRLITIQFVYELPRTISDNLLQMTKFILSQGYSISRESSLLKCFQRLLQMLTFGHSLKFSTSDAILDQFFLLLFHHGQPIEEVHRFPTRNWYAIHWLFPLSATWILDQGADVNVLDNRGRTPLDLAIARLMEYRLPEHRYTQEFGEGRLRLVEIFLGRGGKTRRTKTKDWRRLLQRLLDADYDISRLPADLEKLPLRLRIMDRTISICSGISSVRDK